MNFLGKNLQGPSFFGIVFVLAFALNVTAQSQQDKAQTTTTTGTITGKVVTEGGQPVPNATVFVRGSTALFQPRLASTNNDGDFQVSGLDAALYDVSAAAPTYVLPLRDPDSPSNYYRIGDSATISLIRGGVITGSVVSASGDPVVQVLVQAVLIRDVNGQRPKYGAYQSQRTTDDRGVYRIYGLLPGTYVVSAGGRGSTSLLANQYTTDAPTYAPSSTRDTAAEIVVRAGEDTTGVDIRYRGELGHVISGVVTGVTDPSGTSRATINLMQISNGAPMANAFAFQAPYSKGFAFYGVDDGDYDLAAQFSSGMSELAASEARRITVKGADVTGVQLTIKPLGSIAGHFALEPSTAIGCQNKRQPLFSETLVMARQSKKEVPREQLRLFGKLPAQVSPDKSGNFVLRNLAPGEYSLNVHFFAKYWYLRSIARQAPAAQVATGGIGPGGRQMAVARSSVPLKFGEHITRMTITLAEGAASLRGKIDLAAGENLPAGLYVHLVPAEKENAEDALRFFSSAVNSEGTFAFTNLPPGHYWALARVVSEKESQLDSKLRAPEAMDTSAQLRRTAETAKTQIEFKPCQNVVDYQLALTRPKLKAQDGSQ
jgi:carboxypeptidase family protein